VYNGYNVGLKKVYSFIAGELIITRETDKLFVELGIYP